MMKQITIYISTLLAAIVLFATPAKSQTTPRMVVNIVVGSMQAEDLERYSSNFTTGGFKRLMEQGAWFTNASYDYMQTTTPVSLATISTGALPSTHGVVADSWFEYIGNKRTSLVEDSKEQCVNYSGGSKGYSPRNLFAETISEALAEHDDKSRIATIAIEPSSAIITAGRAGEVYWLENLQASWVTSSFYTKELPQWIALYNRNDGNKTHTIKRWELLLPYDDYRNSQVSCIEGLKSKNDKRITFIGDEKSPVISNKDDVYEQMCYTPAGNNAIFSFAKQLISNNEMGKDESIDMLNIVLDSPTKICQRFGPESVEYEDMIYRLDRNIEELLSFLSAQVTDPRQIIVTLTATHGTSPSYNTPGKEQERFNVRQAEVITNAFIGSQHGNGEWILGCIDNAIYLNHNLIYEKGLSIAEIQHDVATFLMQLRGVSHAVSAEAMRNTYFGSGYGRKIQNGFYPRRSGDVIINLMPGWITEQEGIRSSSGSMYLYDTEVPLIIYGGNVKAARHDEKSDMTSLAVTEARLLGIKTPSAAEGEVLSIF